VVGYGDITEKTENIIPFHSLSHEEINEIYNISDLVLYPSRYEPFGYVTAESWSAGTPVITTAMGLGYELKKIPPFQPFIVDVSENIYENVLRITQWYLSLSEDEKKDIRKEGSAYIKAHYNLEKWAHNIEKVISLLE